MIYIYIFLYILMAFIFAGLLKRQDKDFATDPNDPFPTLIVIFWPLSIVIYLLYKIIKYPCIWVFHVIKHPCIWVGMFFITAYEISAGTYSFKEKNKL